jgi:tetratricopeptide (TPR) repeat protein
MAPREEEGPGADGGAADAPPRRRSLFAEIRRRKIVKTSTAYLIGVFAFLQGVEAVRATFDLPTWLNTATVVLGAVGFPVNVFLAWQAYDDDSDVWTTFARRLPKPTWLLVGALALAAGGLGAWRIWGERHAPPRAQTVLVADLANNTGEPVFDGTLEPALGLALEGATFVSTYRREAARKIANDMKLEGAGLEERRARLVAQREGIGVGVGGSIERTSDGYRVAVRAVDSFTGKEIVSRGESAKSKDAALAVTSKLAARIRAALGDATPEAVQLKEAETYSSASLEAAHAYAMGMAATEEGKYDEAVRQFQEAVRLDPAMGRAWSGLAVVEQNRGRRAEAERYFEKAVAHVDRMSEREKLRTRSVYYLFQSDVDNAIRALVPLVEKYPADNAGHANLGVAWQMKRDFPKALESGRKAIAIYPKKVAQRNNVGLFAMYAGDFDAAVKEQQKVLELNPGYGKAFVGLALAQLASGKRDEAVATWGRLEAFGGERASDAIEGLADLALFEGRIGDARALLERGIEADAREKRDEELSRKLLMQGGVLSATGQAAKAVPLAERARKLSSTDYVQLQAGMLLLAAGDEKRARSVAEELEKRMGNDPRTYALLLQGAIASRAKRHAEAVARLREALALEDSWMVRYALGRAYLEAGAYAQAQEELEKAVLRRGEATDVFLDIVPTFRLYGQAQYHLARAQEGLKSPAAAETYRAFLAGKRGSEDPLVADARKRTGS